MQFFSYLKIVTLVQNGAVGGSVREEGNSIIDPKRKSSVYENVSH